MQIGVLKEIKTKENRVAMTPGGVAQAVANGHQLFVEKSAGTGSGFDDDQYRAAGAKIFASAQEIYGTCEMVIKVKQPKPVDFPMMRKDQIMLTNFNFAAD